MEAKTTLFVPIPSLKELCYVVCKVSNIQIIHPIMKEIYHCQIINCREIIKDFPNSIASPVPKTEQYIYVIITKKYSGTGKLQEFLRKKDIYHSEPRDVNFEIYKTCGKYSIIYKLLPDWRRVGEYLCKENTYSELTEEIDAVHFHLDINEEGMFLRFSPVKLKLFPINLEAMDADKTIIKKFKNNPKISIRCKNQNAYVLPGLKKCILLKITKEIPSKFEHYKVIRDHWKTMYGMRLPKIGDGMNYYKFYFRGHEDRHFVYPELCLQAELPKTMKCNNPTEISNQFLDSLRTKVPELCGKELCFVYHDFKPTLNFLKPKKVENIRETNANPSKASVVRNLFSYDSPENLNVLDYDINSMKSFSFQMSHDSTTFNCDSNFTSSSLLRSVLGSPLKKETSIINSKNESIRHWLQNSRIYLRSSQEIQKTKDHFEKLRESPLIKRRKHSGTEKPVIRSIESIRINLSRFKTLSS